VEKELRTFSEAEIKDSPSCFGMGRSYGISFRMWPQYDDGRRSSLLLGLTTSQRRVLWEYEARKCVSALGDSAPGLAVRGSNRRSNLYSMVNKSWSCSLVQSALRLVCFIRASTMFVFTCLDLAAFFKWVVATGSRGNNCFGGWELEQKQKQKFDCLYTYYAEANPCDRSCCRSKRTTL